MLGALEILCAEDYIIGVMIVKNTEGRARCSDGDKFGATDAERNCNTDDCVQSSRMQTSRLRQMLTAMHM